MKKSLIDNWSLQHAAIVLDNSFDLYRLDNTGFTNAIGGLSNYINSLLLYEETNYPENGFEEAWNGYDWFSKNTCAYIKPLNTDLTAIDWHAEKSYEDNGIENYLITSNYFNRDLFISPERAEVVNIKLSDFLSENNLTTTLKKIDEEINNHRASSWYDEINIGIENNFQLPSLTHYVLKEATSADDLLTVIMQLKSSKKIDRISLRISELTRSTRDAFKFQKEIENIINDYFANPSGSRDWSVSVSALFLSLSKSFNLDFFDRREHIVFLKDIVKCRMESNSLADDIHRIFKRRIF